jgi:Dolichyl-phosphate-mannose-protein mannosyltransferase
LRVAAAIAYRPAIFFGDSWAYLDLAYRGDPVGFAPDRPSGYPLLIDLLSLAGRSLAVITTAQHLAGLGVGVLVYLLATRLGLPRLVGAGAAALVLLDSYAVALEQQILAEAFFTLALVASLYLAVGRDRGAGALAASGALLAAAATIRTVALFVVPVWAGYVLWQHRRARPLVAAALGVLLPLAAYMGLHTAETGRAGLTQADGWFLYGRVAPIADCRGADIPAAARPLCDRTARDRREGAAFHIWNADGPARRNFGPMSRDPEVQEHSNDVLRSFATAIIKDRPREYARLVRDDFLRYFDPGAASRGNSDLAVTFPAQGRLVRRNAAARDRWFPGYRAEVHAPASFLRGYQERFHAPRRLIGLLALAGLLALLASAIRAATGRPSLPRTREVFLLTGAGLGMLLATAATSEFVLRYLIPAVPLLACGGLAGAADLLGALRAWRAQRGSKNISAPTRIMPAATQRSGVGVSWTNRMSTPVTNKGNPTPIPRPAARGPERSGNR